MKSKKYITASGGPFLKYNQRRLKIKAEIAVKHPKWKMGKKFLDSATLIIKF